MTREKFRGAEGRVSDRHCEPLGQARNKSLTFVCKNKRFLSEVFYVFYLSIYYLSIYFILNFFYDFQK